MVKAKFRGLLRKITDSLNTVWASFMEPHQRLVIKTYVDTVDNPLTIIMKSKMATKEQRWVTIHT